MTDRILHWQVSPPYERTDYSLFQIARFNSVSPRNGHSGSYVRIESADWVNVIAITAERTVVLVRQFRHGISAVTLEIPAGIVEPAEDPLNAAQRELEEETGYISDRWIPLGSVYPNPAFQNNQCHTFLAQAARPSGNTHLDIGEDIEVQLLPLMEIAARLRSGEINHALAVAAFLHYLAHGSPGGPLFD